MVFELVYTSLARDGVVRDSVLDEILQVSRLRNLELNITGVLFYEGGEFVQLLEGEEKAVRDLYYGKIQSDRRHRSAYVSWESAKKDRCFPGRQMGFVSIDKVFAQPRDGYLADGHKGLDLSGCRSVGRDLCLGILSDLQSGRGISSGRPRL